MDKDIIKAKQEELQALAFAWAQEQGLVVSSEQVRVKLTVVPFANSDQITEEDWEQIFQERWKPAELAVLNELKENGNEAIWLKWEVITPLQRKFNSRRHRLPFYLSQNFQRCKIVKRLAREKGNTANTNMRTVL